MKVIVGEALKREDTGPGSFGVSGAFLMRVKLRGGGGEGEAVSNTRPAHSTKTHKVYRCCAALGLFSKLAADVDAALKD